MAASAWAAQETYDYDAAGRLRAIQSDTGNTTQFVYDALGNLVSVRATQVTFPPAITSVSPGSVRAGTTTRIRVEGSNLASAGIDVPAPEFSATLVEATAAVLQFDLLAAVETAQAEQTFVLNNPDGSVPFTLTILPVLPEIRVSPLPLALPADGASRQFLVRLSSPDWRDHQIGLSLSDPTIVGLDTATVSIPSGATEAQARIRGLVPGLSTLRLEADGLASAAFTIYVTADFGGVSSAYSDLLGIQVGADVIPAGRQVGGWSNALGVLTGPYVDELSPGVVATGTTDLALSVHGAGLQAVQAIDIEPADGITLSAAQANPDGTRIDLLIGVDAGAVTGWRQLYLTTDIGSLPPAAPGADRLFISAPLPGLASLAPNFGLRGGSGLSLLVRGENLGNARALHFIPPDGITVGASLQASADGSSLGASITIAPDAPLGERILMVETAAGTSDGTPAASNRFIVTDNLIATLNTLSAPQLGVTLGDGGTGGIRNLSEYAANLGLVVGPMVSSLFPGNGEIATSLELLLEGVAMQGASELRVVPPDGVTVAQLTPDPAGEFVSAILDIAADAPQTWRRLSLWAGTEEIPLAAPHIGRFLITAPLPQVEAVSPNTLLIGGSSRVTLHGRNLDRATQVRALPPGGLVIDMPQVAANGLSLGVDISAQAGAEPGPRTLVVATVAGDSSESPGVGNTLTLYHQSLAAPRDFTAPLLGVTVGQGGAVDPLANALLTAPLVGIELGVDGGSAGPSIQDFARLGIAVGAYVESLEAPPLLPGDTYILTLRGQGLEVVDGAGAFPGLDLAVGTPVPSADGTSLVLNLTVPSDAAIEPRQLRLVSGDQFIPFLEPTAARFYLAVGAPDIDSMTPITGRPGDVLELLVRGQNLQNASGVTAEPADAIQFASTLSVNAEGTELRIRLHLADGIALGARTLRIETPGGISTAQASPANTFTVF